MDAGVASFILQAAKEKKQNMVTGGLTAGLGLYQFMQAKKALKSLEGQALPQYGLTSPVRNSIQEADANRYQGFAPAERNAFMNDVTQGSNVAYNRAFSQSPTLSNAISAAINTQNNNAYLKYAALDAQRRTDNRRYDDQLRTQYQTIADKNTGLAINRRDKAEVAYGQAYQTGLNNLLTGTSLLAGGSAVAPVPSGQGGTGGGQPLGQRKPMGYGYAPLDNEQDLLPQQNSNLA